MDEKEFPREVGIGIVCTFNCLFAFMFACIVFGVVS